VELVQKQEVAATIERLAEALLNTPTIEGDCLDSILMPLTPAPAPAWALMKKK
jgi:hypothetical protein